LSGRGEIWTVDCSRRYREFGYQEKGGERSSNFVKREVLIHEKKFRIVGSWGSWTVDLMQAELEVQSFGYQEDEQVSFQ
jgi:hypothetical protein